MNGNTKKGLKAPGRAVFAVALLGLSVILHALHYYIFRDAHHIFIYLLGDIAFVPVNVLLVTLILERLLDLQRRNILIHKLNMVLGAFFSEIGNTLLKQLRHFCDIETKTAEALNIKSDWNKNKFSEINQRLNRLDLRFDAGKTDLEPLKDLLKEKRAFLLSLLANPILMEHDKITDMLWAVLHLTEELTARADIKTLHPRDREHLSEDMRRAFAHLLARWLEYMLHLKTDYPFLFSLAARTNPFDAGAKPEITS